MNAMTHTALPRAATHSAYADSLLRAPTLWALMQRRVELTPDATMLIDAATDRHWRYAQVAQAAEGLAAAFLAQGIGPGTAVTWQVPTSVSAILTALALARLGAVQSPIISLYREAEVRPILERTRSAFYIVPAADPGRDFPAMARALQASLETPPQLILLTDPVPQGDPASLPPPPSDGRAPNWIYYTSGTTSEPKGAMHCDDTLMIGGRNLGESMNATAQSIGSITFPFAHIAGAMYTSILLSTGMSAVVLARFVPAEAVDILRSYKVTITGGSTPHYVALLAEQRKQPGIPLLPDLQVLAGGGAPKPPALYFDVKKEMGVTIVHAYGMTEVPINVAGRCDGTDEQLAYSDGAPFPEVDVRIVREDGSTAEVGEVGEVRVRGQGVFLGYTNPEANKLAFDAEGWFRTGDLGRFRPDGHLALTGRLKDIIIRKGENISAKELEDLLYTHPKVGGVAVIGLPDPERGERVCAVVEPRQPGVHLGFEEMVKFFEDAHVMRQKIPEQLEIMDRLPRNETFNKILKHVLRDRFAA
ncbi:MAG: AMP-binding protein [Rhodocyclaceae bacterium]|jgi:acyl-CoA synthetase (AMP-forming)/AMP-acid ligase II|nr:AMP-binding protein [Rhodocyclaceae bacterium]